MIRLFHRMVLVGGGIFLLAGFVGLIETPIFPWDGVMVVGTTVFSMGLLWRDNVHQAGNWILVGFLWAVMFNMPYYGLNHPNTALLLICIVVSGLLVGGYFQGLIVILVGTFIPLWAYAELTGETEPAVAVQSVEEAVYSTIFWLMAIAVTAGLVWVFARQLERSVVDSRGKGLALAQTSSLLDGEIDLGAFAADVVETAVQQLSAEFGWLFWNEDRPLEYHEGEIVTDGLSYVLTPKDEVWQSLAAEPTVVAIDNATGDGRLPKRGRLAGKEIRGVLLVPVLHVQVVIGVLMLGFQGRRRFAADELELAEAIGQQLSLGLLLAGYARGAQETAVIQERNRMAREMHDVLAQGFTGVIVQLEAAVDVLDGDRDEVERHIGRAQALARRSLQEARRSVRGLRPQKLEDLSLAEALREMVRQMTEGAVVKGVFVCEGDVRPLPAQVENNLLRIGQEGVTNVLKHAVGSGVRVELVYGDVGVRLEIGDDGVGFDPAGRYDGFGLVGMQERAAAIEGELVIESGEGSGTVIRVRWDADER